MSDPYDPLVGHFVAVHRALQALFERCLLLVRSRGLPRADLVAGIRDAVVVLRAHHVFEDTVLMPKLRELGAQGPWDELTSEHGQLEGHLDALDAASPDGDDLSDLEGSLAAIVELIGPHFATEEAHLTDAFWREQMPDEEAVHAWGKVIARVNRDALKPASRLLPLLIYSMDEPSRARFTNRMPGFLVNGLVPYAFRMSWRSRRPFMTHPPARLTPAVLR